MDMAVHEKPVSRPDAHSTKVSDGRCKLRSWLNKQMRIEMSDGRILLGIFLCSDRDGNVILGSCTEYINPEAWGFSDEPRMLGLVMVPGKHIVKVKLDIEPFVSNDSQRPSSVGTNATVRRSERDGDAAKTCGKKCDTGTDPIEWSQNPLWEPDSPDSEATDKPQAQLLVADTALSAAPPLTSTTHCCNSKLATDINSDKTAEKKNE